MKRRILLQVAYDGTDYHGWQYQPGSRTIEGELNTALSELFREPIQVIGASRTDAGVHGLMNLAVFDTNSTIPADRVAYALNQKLPEDIRIQSSREVAGDFHPRKIKTRKTYGYRIYNADFPNPLWNRYAHYTYLPLELERMQQAAASLIGEHDFQSFCAAGSTAETTVRRIYDISVEKEDNCFLITVTGNGFLYNMVRIIAGTLLAVGAGKIDPTAMPAILEARDRTKAGPTAPAKGLTLLRYEFEENL